MTGVLTELMGAMSLLAFCLMGIDKKRARQGKWRISEKTLMTAAALFGAPGALAGMYVFRHKTKHVKFRIGLPVMLAVQLVLLIVLK